MERMAEAELMLEPVQALAYARADFAEPHDRCIALLQARLPSLAARAGWALDLGCGPGDMTRRLARALPRWRIDALDGSPAMLELARADTATDPVAPRVRFIAAHLPDDSPPRSGYDLVFANSILHHLADPAVLWNAVRRWSAIDAHVFVMDLLRPSSDAAARALVRQYAAAEPEVLQTDFYNSLRAAYRPDEVRAQLNAADLAHLTVEVVSGRHFVSWGAVGRSVRPRES